MEPAAEEQRELAEVDGHVLRGALLREGAFGNNNIIMKGGLGIIT